MTLGREISTLASALAAAAFLALPAIAGGPFDGKWVVDVPASDSAGLNTASACAALRLPIEIHDNKVSGSLQRVYNGGSNVVEAGNGRNASPVTGTVQPDGTVTAAWLGYHAVGKLGGGNGVATIDGACGPRRATLTRVE